VDGALRSPRKDSLSSVFDGLGAAEGGQPQSDAMSVLVPDQPLPKIPISAVPVAFTPASTAKDIQKKTFEEEADDWNW